MQCSNNRNGENNGTETMIFRPEEMLGIVDLRSLGYYKIKQGILQQNISKYYRFERAEKQHTKEGKRERFTTGKLSMVRP